MTEPNAKPVAATMDTVYVPDLYEPPRLIALGDIRDLTLGGSAGTGDSGNPSFQEF